MASALSHDFMILRQVVSVWANSLESWTHFQPCLLRSAPWRNTTALLASELLVSSWFRSPPLHLTRRCCRLVAREQVWLVWLPSVACEGTCAWQELQKKSNLSSPIVNNYNQNHICYRKYELKCEAPMIPNDTSRSY